MVFGKLLFGFILGNIASTLANAEVRRVKYEEKLGAIQVIYVTVCHFVSIINLRYWRHAVTPWPVFGIPARGSKWRQNVQNSSETTNHQWFLGKVLNVVSYGRRKFYLICF